VALVGIGNELNGDDAAGVAAARRLRPLFAGSPSVLVLDGGQVVENVTGSLRRFRPDWVILIDAAWFDGRPGEIRGLDWHEADGFSASTHTLPLSVTAAYLESELDCRVLLLGVQAESVIFGEKMSRRSARAVTALVKGLQELFSPAIPPSRSPASQ